VGGGRHHVVDDPKGACLEGWRRQRAATDMDNTERVWVAWRRRTVTTMDYIGRAWAAWRRWGPLASRSLVEPYTRADVKEP
jgi:hypothetical protein